MFICNNKCFCTYDIRGAILGRLKGGGGGRTTKICPFSSRSCCLSPALWGCICWIWGICISQVNYSQGQSFVSIVPVAQVKSEEGRSAGPLTRNKMSHLMGPHSL